MTNFCGMFGVDVCCPGSSVCRALMPRKQRVMGLTTQGSSFPFGKRVVQGDVELFALALRITSEMHMH